MFHTRSQTFFSARKIKHQTVYKTRNEIKRKVVTVNCLDLKNLQIKYGSDRCVIMRRTSHFKVKGRTSSAFTQSLLGPQKCTFPKYKTILKYGFNEEAVKIFQRDEKISISCDITGQSQ